MHRELCPFERQHSPYTNIVVPGQSRVRRFEDWQMARKMLIAGSKCIGPPVFPNLLTCSKCRNEMFRPVGHTLSCSYYVSVGAVTSCETNVYRFAGKQFQIPLPY